ncbi:MAG: hypothetical protein L0Y56_21995, partial [Nitrospira sp.]|nr:hypothetical protein [Nitrospira sp.]
MGKRSFKKASQGLYVALVAMVIAGCASGVDPTAGGVQSTSGPEALFFVANGGDGTVSIVEHSDKGNTVVKTIPVGSGGLGDIVVTTEGHVFVNVTDNNQVAAIDPIVNGLPELRNFLPVGTRPLHGYRDPEGTRVWVMNDGNSTSGPCVTAHPDGGATDAVTVIQNHEVGGGGGGGGTGILGEVIATICVGRGHHKAAFSHDPDRVFVSNITDGTISVIDNEKHIEQPGGTEVDNPEYLHVIATIDLCDPNKEFSGFCDTDLKTTNLAIPHGIDYSPVSGKIYNSNIVYGTVSVIDPITNTIETNIDIGFSGKAHIRPDGEFLIVAGADAEGDLDHVHGKITVINVADNTFNQLDLPDIFPDSFEFAPDGSKLYVATATEGNDTQRDHIKNDLVLSFDTTNLPNLPQPIEIPVGVADGEHRQITIHEHDGEAEHVIVPNPADGTLSIIDSHSDIVVDTVEVGSHPGSVLVFTPG